MSDEKHDDNTTTSDAPERARRVRRTSKVDKPEAAPDAATEASSPAAPRENTERAPRETSKSGTARPRSSSRGPRPERRSPGRPAGRTDGPRSPRRPSSAAAPAAAQGSLLSALSTNRSSKKTIYRQDVVGTPPAMPREESRNEPKKTPDQLMLVWHPAPKSVVPAPKKDARPLTAREALAARHAKQTDQKKAAPKTATSGAFAPTLVQASAEGAFDAAQAAGDAGEALVQAWLAAGNSAAIVSLAARDDAPSAARKAARRALNVLKARGVSVEAPLVAAQKPLVVDEPSECVASYIPPDGNGTAFYSFSQRLPGGRYRVADVMVHESQGVVHASLGHLAGKHLRRWKDRVEESFGLPPIPVSLEWARHAVAEGRRRNDVSKQIVPLAFDSCLVLAGPAPASAPVHPIADLLARTPSDEALAAAVIDSDKLHVDPEFAAWSADRAALAELVAKVGERLTGAEAEDRAAVDRALEEETRAATDRWFSPERREAVAARIADASVAVRVRRGDEAALRVLALAEAIRRAGLVTNPPRDIPFLVAFFQKGIARMARENQGRLPAPVRTA